MEWLGGIFWCPVPAISPENKEEKPALEAATGHIGDVLLDLCVLLLVQVGSLNHGL